MHKQPHVCPPPCVHLPAHTPLPSLFYSTVPMLVPDTQICLILRHAQLWDFKCFLELLPDFICPGLALLTSITALPPIVWSWLLLMPVQWLTASGHLVYTGPSVWLFLLLIFPRCLPISPYSSMPQRHDFCCSDSFCMLQ